jgi:hypothetical protein
MGREALHSNAFNRVEAAAEATSSSDPKPARHSGGGVGLALGRGVVASCVRVREHGPVLRFVPYQKRRPPPAQ